MLLLKYWKYWKWVINMMENKELQNILAKYPDDIPVAISLTYNDVTALLYEIKVNGIEFEGKKALIIFNEDLNYEYETLMNGEEVDEEIYSE